MSEIEGQAPKKKSHGCLIALIVVVVVVVAAIAALAVSCSAKEEVSEFTWPDSELAAQIPVPSWAEVDEDSGDATVTGSLNSESETYFSCYVSVESVDEYSEYVGACEDAGFTVDYSKYDESYYACNEAGYNLSLRYYDEDDSDYETAVIWITLDAPDDEEEAATDDAAAEDDTSAAETDDESSDSDSDGVDPDFKEWCDGYESFMDEYVDFMLEYQDADETDTAAMLEDYYDLLEEAAEWDEQLAEYEDAEDDMSSADLEYYLEVTERVSERLLELYE